MNEGWHNIGGGRTDISFAAAPGSRAGQSRFVVGDHNPPFRFLSTLALWIQLDPAAALVLTDGAPMPSFARRRGLGRVRKNMSTPLEPDGDQVWIQSVDGDAVLVVRSDAGPDEHAFFPIGPLGPGAAVVADMAGSLQVIVVIAEDFLPDASWQHFTSLIAERQAWGGLVGCIGGS